MQTVKREAGRLEEIRETQSISGAYTSLHSCPAAQDVSVHAPKLSSFALCLANEAQYTGVLVKVPSGLDYLAGRLCLCCSRGGVDKGARRERRDGEGATRNKGSCRKVC